MAGSPFICSRISNVSNVSFHFSSFMPHCGSRPAEGEAEGGVKLHEEKVEQEQGGCGSNALIERMAEGGEGKEPSRENAIDGRKDDEPKGHQGHQGAAEG